ncbi:MAG TPA: Fe-S cluster assembly protein IscX [Phototrophicaceae bacterium]|nr:Fe-S cluster assembly protein IscX [Phototrophicaceae bacterium]
MFHKLYWEFTQEIVLMLIETYPDMDLDTIGLEQLYQYIVTLPDFADDPTLANDGILNEILREWYEEVNS